MKLKTSSANHAADPLKHGEHLHCLLYCRLPAFAICFLSACSSFMDGGYLSLGLDVSK